MCESCHMGKHHHSTYLAHNSIPSSYTFDLVHHDLWNPLMFHIHVNLHYIISIDDYTDVSLLYLIAINLSKRIFKPYLLTILSSTKPFSLRPPYKMTMWKENIKSSLTLLIHYYIICISLIICGPMPYNHLFS